jgi:glycosyltransferase involved in cell wall biosynthesis
MILTMHDEWFLHPISHYKEHVQTSLSRSKIIQYFSTRINQNRLNLKFKIVNKDRVYIICPSEQLALKFSLQFPKKSEKIFFVPNPVDLTEFYPQDNAKYLNLSAESLNYPVAFYLGGTNNLRKGWDLLESALDLIEIPFVMLMIGKSSRNYYGKFNQIKVINLKKVYGVENLRNLYSLSHFVIVPSRDEAGGPQTATEALSCGTPVVGFKSGTMENLVRNGITGELVNSLNSTDLSHAIMKVLMNKKVIYEKNCRLAAEEFFSYDKVLNEYLLLLNSKVSY